LSTFSTASATAKTVHAISASVASGSWSIVHGTFGSSLAALYVNGLGQAYQPTTGSLVGYNASNQLYAGASYGLDSGFYTGSMANVTVNNADLDGLTVNKNYNALATRFSLPIRRPTVTDADAFNFVEAAGISGTQAEAINTLVLGLKANNLWTKMQAIYPFVGGTAYSHKWNLKDPRDVDAAFRLQYFGTVTHTNLGISGSSNGYAGTFYYPITNNSQINSSVHISAYTITPNNFSVNIHGTLMGNSADGSGLSLIPNYTNGGSTYYQLNFSIWKSLSGASSTNVGLYVASRTSTTDVALYRRINTGNTSTSTTDTAAAINNNAVKILFSNYTGWTGTVGFSTIGYGLSATDVTNLDTIISAFQTALGRKPF
jgi:hypothetical protein